MSKALRVVNNGLNPLESLPYLRTTGFRTFNACQRQWAVEFLSDKKQKDNVWSKIGTAAHFVVEHVFRSAAGLDHASDDEIAAEWLKVPGDESEELTWYVDYMMSLKYKSVLGVEDEFQIELPGVGMKIKGTLDLILELDNGDIMIVDHKTNRSFEGVSYWQADIQPLIYAMATRMKYPGRVIHYKLGYINLSRTMGTVDWVTDPNDDVHVERFIRESYETMVYNEWTGHWPATVHPECHYCPLYKEKSCEVHNDSVRVSLEVMKDKLTTANPARRVEILKAFIGYAEMLVDEAKEEIKTKIAESPTGRVLLGEHEYFMVDYSERALDPNDAMGALNAWVAAQNPNTMDLSKIPEIIGLLFTAKVGGIDKIKSIEPGIAEMLEARLTKKEFPPRMKQKKVKTLGVQ